MDSMTLDLSDFLPFFKMFPGIYQVVNEKLIEEIKSYPFWSDLDRLVRDALKDEIEDVQNLIFSAEEKLFKDARKKDDEFFNKKEFEVPLEMFIGGGKTLSVTIIFKISSNNTALARELKNGREIYIPYSDGRKRHINFLNLVEEIELVIKDKDGSDVFEYTLLPESMDFYYFEDLYLSGNYKRSDFPNGNFPFSYWGNIEVFNFSTFQEQGDSWKRVTFSRDSISIMIKKGNLYFTIPFSYQKDTKRVDITFEEFGVEIEENLPENSDSLSRVLLFESSAIVLMGKDKAKFFIRVSPEDVRRNSTLQEMGISDDGIYVTKKPVSFRLLHSPNFTQRLGSEPWLLILGDSSWKKVSSIPPNAFEVKVLDSFNDSLIIGEFRETEDPEQPFNFLVDKETLLKLPFYPEIFDKK